MDRQRLSELFERYTAGDLSPDEQTLFFRLLDQSAHQQEELDPILAQWWDETHRYRDSPLQADGQRRIRQVMEKVQPDQSKYWLSWGWMAAACILLILSVVAFWNRPEEAMEVAQLNIHEISTTYGQRKTVRMPDGSVIRLNAGSVLRYTDDYNLTEREVALSGEAFFEVASDPQKRFVVQHDQLAVEVLGTSFNVRDVGNDGQVQVAVATGAVTVKTPADSTDSLTAQAIVLHPGQELTYDYVQQRTTVTRVEDMAMHTAWKEGLLVLNGLSFGEAATMMERWYGVRIKFNNEALKRCRFTGEFNNLPINKVLDLLARSSGFSYRIEGKDIYIDGKACN